MSLAEVSEVARCEELSNKIDASLFSILPCFVAANDVGMVQLEPLGQISDNRVHLLIF